MFYCYTTKHTNDFPYTYFVITILKPTQIKIPFCD